MAASLKLVEDKKVNADRQKALDAALAQIDRAFGKGSAMKLGQKEAMNVEAISTGSLGLDIALGVGGLPKGRVIEVYGPESSGKTTLTPSAVRMGMPSWFSMVIITIAKDPSATVLDRCKTVAEIVTGTSTSTENGFDRPPVINSRTQSWTISKPRMPVASRSDRRLFSG